MGKANRKSARRELRAAEEHLIYAIRNNAALARNCSESDGHWARYSDSSRDLRSALLRYSEAGFECSGTAPYSLEDWSLDDSLDEELPDCLKTGDAVVVQALWKFRIQDYDTLLKAGRKAYQSVWPESDKSEARMHVVDASSAISEFIHAYGWDRMESSTPGLCPIESETVVTPIEDADIPAGENWNKVIDN